MLRLVAGSQFVLEADDHRIITYRTTENTKVDDHGKPAELKSFAAGDHLSVDATSDDQGYFTATAVTLQTAGKPEASEAVALSRVPVKNTNSCLNEPWPPRTSSGRICGC